MKFAGENHFLGLFIWFEVTKMGMETQEKFDSIFLEKAVVANYFNINESAK